MASRTRRFYRFFFGTSIEVIQGEQLSQTTFIIVVDSIVRQRADQLGLKLFLHIWTDIFVSICQLMSSERCYLFAYLASKNSQFSLMINYLICTYLIYIILLLVPNINIHIR